MSRILLKIRKIKIGELIMNNESNNVKYYKILREDMCHNGYQYHLGENIDTKNFNKRHECGGGMFFSDKDNILGFCDYGTLIAEVEPIGKIVKVDKKYKAHGINILSTRPLWDIETFKWLLNEKNNIHAWGEDRKSVV